MRFDAAALLRRARAALPGPKRLRIVLRQSPDWRNTAHADLIEGSRAFCRMVAAATGLTENFISDVVAVWDRTFPMAYFHLRAEMKDIALENLAAVRSAARVPLRSADAGPAAELHLFIDDDDWLHPRLYFELQRYTNAADGYVFGNILCDSRVQLRRVEDGCYTNNYAVSARYLSTLDGRTERVAQHWDAHAAFHEPGFRLTHVPLYLSATNKHPASAMKLKDGLQQAELSAATLRRLVERYVDESTQAEIPEPASWVAPLVRRVRDVFASLL
jgi:hypothetical protein